MFANVFDKWRNYRTSISVVPTENFQAVFFSRLLILSGWDATRLTLMLVSFPPCDPREPP